MINMTQAWDKENIISIHHHDQIYSFIIIHDDMDIADSSSMKTHVTYELS